jgi:dCTP deaminase
MTLLSDVAIKRHMEYGSIVIEPFRPERLNTDSYDLELGPYFYRYHPELRRKPQDLKRGEGFDLVDGRPEGGIWLHPGERVLGHTVEIAGGRIGEKPNPHYMDSIEPLNKMMGTPTPKTAPVAVTTHLQATSTAGRHGFTVCECAGWGDVGFVNIWTLEIQNKLSCQQFLPIGALIAQVAFSQVETPSAEYGDITGQYQPKDAVTAEEIREAWSPKNMLPGPLKVRNGWVDMPWDF